MYVFKEFGVNLPHNARTQANYGTYTSKADLKAGDLVIFNNSSNTSIGSLNSTMSIFFSSAHVVYP